MKRLRLRKIWVVLAVLVLLVPFLSGQMEKTEASATTTTTAAEDDGVLDLVTIKFLTNTGAVTDDGVNVPQFQFPTISGNETKFDEAVPATLTAHIYFGSEAADEIDLATYYDIAWKYSVDGENWVNTPGVNFSQTDNIVQIDPKDVTTQVKKEFLVSPGNAGVHLFHIKVELTNKSTGIVTSIPRSIMLKVPLQIFYKDTPYYKTYTAVDATKSVDILTNKADKATIFWYFYDSETDEYIKLEDTKNVNLDDIKSRSSTLISGMGEATPCASGGGETYSYSVTSGKYGGLSRIVGRIFLGNNPDQNDSAFYVQQSFDLFINPLTLKDTYDMEYGDILYFKNISNDKGNSLEWYLDGHGGYNDRTMPTVVELDAGLEAVVGRYYGTETLWLTPIPRYEGGDFWNTNLSNKVVEKSITFTTKFDILKGDVAEYREKAEDIEVVDVEGKMTLSTNVNMNGQTYDFKWSFLDGGTWREFGVDDAQFVSCTGVNVQNGSWSAIQLVGKKAGTLKIKCEVSGGDIDGVLIDELTLKVVDALTLTENFKTIEVGSSFEITASSSDLIGTITWESSDENYVTVYPFGNPTGDPVGRKMEVYGVAVTGDNYITITATQVSSGRTATCKVKVVEALSPVRIEGDTVLVTESTGNLELIFEGNTPNYSAGDIEWIVKDKGDWDAESLIKVQQEPLIPTQATVTSFDIVGEAYVAVVLNEVRGSNQVKTELAVVTIKVVSPPEGITLNAPQEVIGYIDEGFYQLEATIEPQGYVDSDALTIEWVAGPDDDTIISLEVDPEDSKKVKVNYLAPGEATVTARIKGTLVTTFVNFTIRERATEIILDPADGLVLKEGMTGQIKATVKPETATNKELTWTSMNESVATVDQYGLVTAVKAGSTSIVVRSADGVEAICPVTVLVAAERIELNYYDITVKKNTIFYLSAQVIPVDTYDKTVTFVSSDEDIVTVEPDGTVTAVGVGVAEITVTSNDNPDIEPAICVVTVVEAVSGITLNSREVTIDVGEQYLLKATVHPSDATNNKVTFKSADESIATVSENGLITGIKGGTTVVFVTTEERGLTASCTVIVQEDITSITLSETETYVGKGKNKKITATILPTSATKKKLLWKSSDESIVIVDQEGNIHGVNLGTATITATAQDDGKVSATCKVTVVDEITKITLNQTIIRMAQDDTYQLTYTIEPNYASVKMVSWSTSDASVARVDSLGLVTAVGGGEAKIRATATDGSGVYAECTIIVQPLIAATSIQVNTTNTTMVVGDSRTLTARMLPRNTSETVRWVSDDTSVATIDNNGNLTAVGPGVCKVTAISNKTGLESVSTITVLGLNASNLTLEQYDTFDLYLDGIESGVTWFSRNKRVATVSRKGVITGRQAGTTEIVARVNGKMVSCMVSVEKLKK